MEFKDEIILLLSELKALGVERSTIEADLDYSENYIDQQLAKGGNARFLQRLRRYRNALVHGVAKSNTSRVAVGISVEGTAERQLLPLLVNLLERQNELMARQNTILERQANNIEEKVESVESKTIELSSQLTQVSATVRTVSLRQEAEGETVLHSLERLEKKTKGSLVAAADMRRNEILQEWHKRDKKPAKRR